MVIGGQAVLLHGEPRLTRDVDITLGVSPDRLADVLAVVEDTGLRPLVEPESFVNETLVLPCEEAASGIRVDLIFSFPGYERAAMERTSTAEVGGEPVRFASVEDLVVLKLVAGRPRDLESRQAGAANVRGVLVRQPDLDTDYVKRWLSEFDVALGVDTQGTFDRILEEVR